MISVIWEIFATAVATILACWVGEWLLELILFEPKKTVHKILLIIAVFVAVFGHGMNIVERITTVVVTAAYIKHPELWDV